jgi:hypothetical protein
VSAFDRHRQRSCCADPAILKRQDGNPAFMAVGNRFGTVWTIWVPEEKRNQKWWKELREAQDG